MNGPAKAAKEIRPFSFSGYEILDDDLWRTGEVTIWSVVPLTPKLGDVFLIESGGESYDAKVEELAIFRGGWSARCFAERIAAI